MTSNEITSIVIAGGGTSGWMTAAALSHHFTSTFPDKKIAITLVESSQLGTIGVGEATIPTLRRFYQKLGFTDIDVIKATNATCKLGIEFKGWTDNNSNFIHPFGLFGQGTKEVPFIHYWLKAQKNASTNSNDLNDFSLGVNLAQQNKFFFPPEKPNSQLDIFDWALHFDAALFANLMREYSVNHGVQLIDNIIEVVNISPTSGNIDSLTFKDGTSVSADLFIDCSGFKALLIEGALKTGFDNWSHWLFNDSAVAVQSKITSTPITRTISQAKSAGWQWQIPLQNRMGNGYVFSSQYLDKESAKASLLADIDGDILHEPRSFTFTPGRRKKAWNKNCIAVGLSSGFLEPLESTSIALVETAIEKIILSFNTPHYNDNDINRFNEVNALEYERVRDFIIFHYKANQRNDSPMWQRYRDMEIPEKLAEKMQQFKETGNIIRYPWEIFGADSWLAVFNGLNYLPTNYDARADKMDNDYLQLHLEKMKKIIKQQVDNAPTHTQFLVKYCGYQP
ncbi:tryptophan 7-halogenase [Colwellia sp. D2M02]|uniref:tryptophan halogenase family protein n=1 Tax=Colwellia sp. D2M02 TaxID=2841562 RepID=UPI001C08BC9D|nr:tryptophan halogenase family protein [Colwellia sp. D2M02]MBU2893307.1 tryptophan 7-halogenase [Colwellia sp. D2M02]